eukprot:2190410-Pyramimonas_sp.AAC.1
MRYSPESECGDRFSSDNMAQFKLRMSECTSSGSSFSVEHEGSIRTNISTDLIVKCSDGTSIKQPDDDIVANDDRILGLLGGGSFSPSIIPPYLEPATPPSKA